jgi:amino acid transporter
MGDESTSYVPLDEGAPVSSYVNTAENVTADPSLPQGKGQRNLTWWRLAMITFVFTCSGPGGLEQVVIAGGPLVALIGIFIVPFVYVMPQIFVVSELGSMMPTSAGNVVWVHRAFGRFTGFYNAWLFSLTNMIDMAGYPILFGDYIVSTFHSDATYWESMAYRFLGLVICVVISLLSAKDVSTITTVASVAIIGFCVVTFFAATPKLNPKTQWSSVQSDIDYSLLGSSLLWLYTGWTSLGALAGETTNSLVLLQGMSSALVLDVSVYVVALLAALSVSTVDEWEDGFFVTAFNRVLPGEGPYFGAAVCFTALTLAISAMICYSRGFWGMAEMSWAPRVFTRQLSTGAPHYAVLAHAVVAFGLMWFDFGFILQVEYTVAAVGYLLTYACFVRLRYSEPDAPRPYKVPGGLPFAYFITTMKFLVMGATMIAGLVTDWRIDIAFVATNIGIIAGYFGYRHFNPEQPALPVHDESSEDLEAHAMIVRKSLNPAQESMDEQLRTPRIASEV